MKYLLIVSLFILLPISIILPQYLKTDSDLVKTTFTKEFNRKIIGKCLNSGNSRKVKAALLSIAQSEDTTWVPQIIKINFSNTGKRFVLLLGNLGSAVSLQCFY
jgi:hypothetical protein